MDLNETERIVASTMTVSDKNGEIASWKISSARGGYRTPTGIYTPHYTARMHYSKQYHFSPMPYSVFFNDGEAFHKGSVTARSHGCVHLTHRAAQTFYNTLHVGDVVQVVH